MPLAYAISDIVISSSILPEAFGRVAVEAQAMEKPIIASNLAVPWKQSLIIKLVYYIN